MTITDVIDNFHKNGYSVVPDFLTPLEVESLIRECELIVNDMDPAESRSVFMTGKNQIGDEYFLNSVDKISFFFEKDSIDDEGNLVVEKSKSLNKIGHALHWLNPEFKKVSFSNKVKDLLRRLEYKDPVIVQSMFIFKHPKIGGEVVPHQDSTYLFTTPQSTLGLWFPLVDVSEENGCLWAIPGSHKGPVYQRFIRNPSKDPLLVLKGEIPSVEGQYKPIPAKRGDCVIIHGSVLHKSEKNNSPSSRPVYTFHIVENKDTIFSPENWIQPTEKLPFPSVYEN